MHRAVAAAALLLGLAPDVAEACGGCFAPPTEVTTVDSHRMVVAVGLEETILWDQIRYSGNPRDFVWVLPVPAPDIRIEVADDAFFDELDAQTTPRLSPPPLLCTAGGCTPGPAAAAESTVEQPQEEVTVYSEETVGPYDTVVIGSRDPDALYRWLVEHDYNVPDETLPVIAGYVEDRSVFVALRLSPGQGVSAMQPVRVHYPGAMTSFPLRMVTVGASGQLDLSLWIVAEQRYEIRNYPTVRIDPESLVWDWERGRSNYAERFDATLELAGGRGWIVEHASPLGALFFSSPEAQVAAGGHAAPYVTRLRTRMRTDHMNQDLVLAPSAEAGDVQSALIIRDRNRPECQNGGCALGSDGLLRPANLIVPSLGLIGLALLRRVRRQRP